jgi:hypothetical protein
MHGAITAEAARAAEKRNSLSRFHTGLGKKHRAKRIGLALSACQRHESEFSRLAILCVVSLLP